MVRFPGVYRALAALVLRRLRPRSRLRRALARRTQISAYAAASRRDFELMLVRYARDVEVEFDPDLEPLGISGTFRGHDGVLKMIEAFGEAWEQWEIFPTMGVDMGNDRGLGLGHFRLPGTSSGLVFEREFAQLVIFKDGLVVYEREFLSWEKGLRAAGLDPDAFALERSKDEPTSARSAPPRVR
jgi:ketosteroid isomerase-like protein